MALPPLMYTEKLTLYIGRDAEEGDDSTWHIAAKKKCSSQAKRFDLGCSKPRKISNHVFCHPKYCVCYVQYGQCNGMSFKGKNSFQLEYNNIINLLESIYACIE